MRHDLGSRPGAGPLQALYQTRTQRRRRRQAATARAVRVLAFGLCCFVAALYQTGLAGPPSASRTAAAPRVPRPPQSAPLSAARTERTEGRLPDTDRTVDRIAAFIRAVQPGLGAEYAHRLAATITDESARAGVSPFVVAATAYVESEFHPESGPCIGVMQIDPPTAQSYRNGSGLDASDLRGNVRIGARELARHQYVDGRQASLRRMWGRYNGCGPSGEYVDRSLRVLYRMRRTEADAWRQHLASTGPLWLE